RERLQQEVRRSGLHRFHSILDGAERRHHDHWHMRIHAADDLQHLKPGHPRQLEVGQDEIGAVDQREGFFSRRRLLNRETGIEQLQFEDAAQVVFVFDYQNLSLHDLRGRSTRNVLPLPGMLSTDILPPCPSTIFATIARPRPTPACFVVTNGLKMVSILCGGTPHPCSITLISAWSSTSRVLTVIGASGAEA